MIRAMSVLFTHEPLTRCRCADNESYFDVLRGVRSRFTVRQLLFLVEHVFEGLILLHGPWFSIFTSHKASAHYTLEPAEQP